MATGPQKGTQSFADIRKAADAALPRAQRRHLFETEWNALWAPSERH
jgi:hypothetical protein